MMLPAELRKAPGLLTAMIVELQTNQAALNDLADSYGVFLFTGGDLPRGRCGLVAVTSYLKRPFASDRISLGEIQHYGHVVETLMTLGQRIAAPRPRTPRSRRDMADVFSRVFSNIRTLGSTLESVLTQLSKEQE